MAIRPSGAGACRTRLATEKFSPRARLSTAAAAGACGAPGTTDCRVEAVTLVGSPSRVAVDTTYRPGDGFAGRRRATLRLREALSRHHVRVPDERARLRADEGDARVARVLGGGGARRGRRDPLQHLLDPREGRQPPDRPPRRGEAPQGGGPVAHRRGRGLLGPVAEGR